MVARAKDRAETRGMSWGGKLGPRMYTRKDDRFVQPVAALASPPNSITALVFGDPLPGRSALDQRKPR